MSTLVNAPAAQKIWFDSENLWVLLSDGRQLAVPLSYFPTLLHAPKEARENYVISGGGTGLQ
ncbi:MAG: DUF2442 domain-containing protein [Spirochaetia bacterium]